MLRKMIFISLALLLSIVANAQTLWKSSRYGYTAEIPKGFNVQQIVGSNVDFKASSEESRSSITIGVKQISFDNKKYTIGDLINDLPSYVKNWEEGAYEYFNTPQVLKYGKTTLSGATAIWFDYLTDNGLFYYKNYQVVKGNLLYTITFSCMYSKEPLNAPIWYRFKESLKL